MVRQVTQVGRKIWSETWFCARWSGWSKTGQVIEVSVGNLQPRPLWSCGYIASLWIYCQQPAPHKSVQRPCNWIFATDQHLAHWVDHEHRFWPFLSRIVSIVSIVSTSNTGFSKSISASRHNFFNFFLLQTLLFNFKGVQQANAVQCIECNFTFIHVYTHLF